jgi:hypothetical protein
MSLGKPLEESYQGFAVFPKIMNYQTSRLLIHRLFINNPNGRMIKGM